MPIEQRRDARTRLRRIQEVVRRLEANTARRQTQSVEVIERTKQTVEKTRRYLSDLAR